MSCSSPSCPSVEVNGRLCDLIDSGGPDYDPAYLDPACDYPGDIEADFPPGECGCLADGDTPATLDWTYVGRRWDASSSSVVTLGTTSGTLTFRYGIPYGDCVLPLAGWVGEFEFWTDGIPPDTGVSSLLLEHCSTRRPGGESTATRCLWLALTCSHHGSGSYPDGYADLLWLATIDGDATCYTYAVGDASLDGFDAGQVSGGTFTAGPVDGWLALLCASGTIEVSFPHLDGGGAILAESTLTISM